MEAKILKKGENMKETRQLRKTPTDKMVAALSKFGVPQNEISGMSFEDASSRLSLLIKQARERKGLMPIPASPDSARPVTEEIYNPEYDVKQRAIEAKRFVEREFGNTDYFNGMIISEIMHEEFALFMERKIQQNKQRNIQAIQSY
jgi:hypothetical protein